MAQEYHKGCSQSEKTHKSGNSHNRRKAGGKKRELLLSFLHLELMIVVATLTFLIGQKLGEKSGREKAFAVVKAGNYQDYGAEKEAVGAGQMSNEPQSSDRAQGDDESRSNDKVRISDEERLTLLWEKHPQLILVNKDHKLPADYEVTLKKIPGWSGQADELAYDALVEMLKDGGKKGLDFKVCSSYRSVERQQELLDEDIDALMRKGYSYREAYAEVTRETMPPGHSEHATGLAFDIVALDYQILDSKQKDTDENKWLRKHCAEYGFILRYPEGKEDITGISYESWHFRYVGEEVAAYIMKNGITLEEYLEEYLRGEADIYN